MIGNTDGGAAAPTVEMTVTDDKPRWMTSEASGACGAGMVFSVNAPEGKSVEGFQLAAMKTVTGLRAANIAVQNAPAQVASTVTINTGSIAPSAATTGLGSVIATAAAGAAGAVASSGSNNIVPGIGTTGNGSACSCECFCGAMAYPAGSPDGIGSFGGYLGMWNRLFFLKHSKY